MHNNPLVHVLAGVNGAGKSSIGAAEFAAQGAPVFNPDTVAQEIRNLHPDITLPLANAQAWQIGKTLLEQAIRNDKDYRFETTLGGNTITRLLEQAARGGHQLHIWFFGLESSDLHIRRVASRVAHGGHDISAEKIRERWTRSRENLVRLLPLITHLRVYDNSAEGDPAENRRPQPLLLLEMKRGKILTATTPPEAPDWAKPILAAAFLLQAKGEVLASPDISRMG